MQWASSLAEMVNKANKNMFIPTCFRSHIAQTANGSDFFPIAMKTMKYVCYNSAGINEQNTAGVSHFAVTRLG